jgi:hypothetical protein
MTDAVEQMDCQVDEKSEAPTRFGTHMTTMAHGRMARGGLGLPKDSSGPAMPYPSMPCGRANPETAISGVARRQGGRLVAVF